MIESLLEILAKSKIQIFYKPLEVHSVTNATDVSISSISKWNIGNELGKNDFLVVRFFLWVGYNLKGRKLFLDLINKNYLELILGTRGRYCCTT